LLEETASYNQQTEERKAQLHEMASELERMTNYYGEMEEMNHQLQGEINDILYQKQLNSERISYRQKFSKRLKEISQVGIDNTQSLQIERRLLSASQALENVKEIISDLQASNPHLGNVLSRVLEMTDPVINFAY
jgi:septation ring formation regulator EzrA